MWEKILAGFLGWVNSTEKVKMRALDLQEKGLDLQTKQLNMQEKTAVLDRQEKMLRIAIAQSDLNARNDAQALAAGSHAPTPLNVVPEQPEVLLCKCDKTDEAGGEPVEMTEIEALKAEATSLNIAFRSNVTVATLKKKIKKFQENAEKQEPPTSPADEPQVDPGRNYKGDEIRSFCRAHMVTQKSVDGDNGRNATKAFLKDLTGFEGPAEMEKEDNAQELLNMVAAACIELGLTIPEDEGEV